MISLNAAINLGLVMTSLAFWVGFYLGFREGHDFGKTEAEIDAAFDRIEAKLRGKS